MKLTDYKIELKWAAIFIGFTWLWLFMEKALGYHDTKIADHPTISNLITVPAILIYLFALINKRKSFYSGYMTYKQGLVSGLVITLLIALFVPISQMVISKVITPDYFANAIAYSVAEEKVSQGEAEAYFNLQSYIMQGMLGTILMGSATTLLLALFVKKKSKSDA